MRAFHSKPTGSLSHRQFRVHCSDSRGAHRRATLSLEPGARPTRTYAYWLCLWTLRPPHPRELRIQHLPPRSLCHLVRSRCVLLRGSEVRRTTHGTVTRIKTHQCNSSVLQQAVFSEGTLVNCGTADTSNNGHRILKPHTQGNGRFGTHVIDVVLRSSVRQTSHVDAVASRALEGGSPVAVSVVRHPCREESPF